MISDTLAFFAPGSFALLIIFIFWIIPAALVVLIVLFVLKGSKEKEKLRQQMTELTEELKRTQEQLQSQKKDES